jgi:hypothetical protein
MLLGLTDDVLLLDLPLETTQCALERLSILYNNYGQERPLSDVPKYQEIRKGRV